MVPMREQDGLALWEIGGRYYVTEIDRDKGQVYSVVPSDRPADGGAWFSRISPVGVQYVARGRTEQTAKRWFRRLLPREGDE